MSPGLRIGRKKFKCSKYFKTVYKEISYTILWNKGRSSICLLHGNRHFFFLVKKNKSKITRLPPDQYLCIPLFHQYRSIMFPWMEATPASSWVHCLQRQDKTQRAGLIYPFLPSQGVFSKAAAYELCVGGGHKHSEHSPGRTRWRQWQRVQNVRRLQGEKGRQALLCPWSRYGQWVVHSAGQSSRGVRKAPRKRRHCGWRTADHNGSRPSVPTPSVHTHLDHNTQEWPLLCSLVMKRTERKWKPCSPPTKWNNVSYKCANEVLTQVLTQSISM